MPEHRVGKLSLILIALLVNVSLCETADDLYIRVNLYSAAITDNLFPVYCTDGCFRTSMPPEPAVKTTDDPIMDASGPQPTHKLECVPEEIQRQGCLNGGSCFAIRMYSSRQLGCT